MKVMLPFLPGKVAIASRSNTEDGYKGESDAGGEGRRTLRETMGHLRFDLGWAAALGSHPRSSAASPTWLVATVTTLTVRTRTLLTGNRGGLRIVAAPSWIATVRWWGHEPRQPVVHPKRAVGRNCDVTFAQAVGKPRGFGRSDRCSLGLATCAWRPESPRGRGWHGCGHACPLE